MVNSIYQSVFNPSRFIEIIEDNKTILYLGWILILIRWGYYSVLFSFFRDYNISWKPFVKPPFNLSIEQYSSIQSKFSILFGFFLMSSLTLSIWLYFRIRKKHIELKKIFNVLGYTFFLPFVILQIVDLISFQIIGWDLITFTITHTLFLIWEAIVTIVIISKLIQLKIFDKIISSGLLIIIWIIICSFLWR